MEVGGISVEFGTANTSGCNLGVGTIWNPAVEMIPVINVPNEGELFISVFILNTCCCHE